MPHKDMSHWQAIYRNKPVQHKFVTSVEELATAVESIHGQTMDHLYVGMPEIGEMHEQVDLRGEGQTPTAEIYIPKGEGPFPVFVHFHGGGWVTGGAIHERRFGHMFAERGFVVVNVDYALAPQNPFPEGLTDCVYAMRWVQQNIAAYKGDPSRITLGGGSAGANLAAATVAALHGKDLDRIDGGDLDGVEVEIKALILMYGLLNVHRWIAEPGYYAGDSEIMVQAYLGPNFTGRLKDPLVSPIFHEALAEFPPTYLSIGDEDAFLPHSTEMAIALAGVDVPVTLSVVAGADHEFHKVPEFVLPAAEENDRMVTWLERNC